MGFGSFVHHATHSITHPSSAISGGGFGGGGFPDGFGGGFPSFPGGFSGIPGAPNPRSPPHTQDLGEILPILMIGGGLLLVVMIIK